MYSVGKIAASWLAIGWGLAACTAATLDPDCVVVADCDTGFVCRDGSCLLACNIDTNCAPAEICLEGVCVAAQRPGCEAHSECSSDDPCNAREGICVGGRCGFSPLAAGTACDDGDSCTIDGVCDGLGNCESNPVLCIDNADGCRSNGMCDSNSSPVCGYDAWPNGTPPAGSVCGLTGRLCLQGGCVDCIDAGDCPAASHECVESQCLANQCVEVPTPGVACGVGVQTCANGVVTPQPTCDLNGACATPPLVDCGGLICAGDACLGSCTGDPECIGVLLCDLGSGECLRGDPGEACTANAFCLDVCINGTCALPSALSGPCDETADCVAGTACSSGNECLLVAGESCTNNSDCVGTCVGGLCAPPRVAGETCDDDGDCSGGATCFDGLTCTLDLGGVCTQPSECRSGWCADGYCCDSACDGPCQACSSGGTCEGLTGLDSGCSDVDCSVLDTACAVTSQVIPGGCTIAGVCDTVTQCAPPTILSAGTVCRPAGNCISTSDVCDGISPNCPPLPVSFVEGDGCLGSPWPFWDIGDNSVPTLEDEDRCVTLCNTINPIMGCSLVTTDTIRGEIDLLCLACGDSTTGPAVPNGFYTSGLTCQ